MRKLVPVFDRRKPERHLRQMQDVRSTQQRSVEPPSAVERRQMARDVTRTR